MQRREEESNVFIIIYFFSVVIEDNYMNMSNKNITTNSHVWIGEEGPKVTCVHYHVTNDEEILHMPPQFLWTKVTSEAIIYPWMNTVFHSWYAVNYFLQIVFIFQTSWIWLEGVLCKNFSYCHIRCFVISFWFLWLFKVFASYYNN